MASPNSVAHDQTVITEMLNDVMMRYSRSKTPFRVIPVFDDTTQNYLLMDEGWDGYKRVHRVWLHVEVKDGKFYIHEDETQEGIANRLLATGIPKERIVLSWHAPNVRGESGFAVA